ncbi:MULTISPECIES: protein-L-isoaspartate O-methyltransferase family protein [Aminobacter]|uniref:protein-L-isoaspartate O-methyltransferase family protein n=1 Tax=Aminobacter TaxID=31988 RepID=UPI000D39CAE1|nr:MULTISPECIES: protein-L-isoaspartate O-methyltransferase [Aminobacter]AWC24287.1 Protein-L-isoaspartate O-methyltransferase [Aminobacter sp. MSH1]CAI2934981.1 Protein-L-isoaspartate O-methyltransferase [Aminobacter niigataensis]
MNADFSERRVKMVDGQVRTTDVTDAAILSAMLSVPREAFVDSAQRELAYIDEDLRYGVTADSDQPRYLMEPSPFAKLAQLAEIGPRDFVLDVGSGTGYSSAVLSKLASSVIALESDPTLAATATSTLSSLGCDNVVVVSGPLAAGYASQAPYDVIFVGGSVEQVPDALLAQLKEGGRLVAVEGRGNAGVASVYLKADGNVTARRAFNAAVKPLPGFNRTREFEF